MILNHMVPGINVSGEDVVQGLWCRQKTLAAVKERS